jgi:hypothetical protein
MGNSENFEGLLPGNKAAFNSEALFGNLLATFVAELFHIAFVTFFMKILNHLLAALFGSQWTDVVLAFFYRERALHLLVSCLISRWFFFDRSLITTRRLTSV